MGARVSDTALLAVVLAAIAGLLAGRAWAAALRRGAPGRPARASTHFVQGLRSLASGQTDLATSELSKVAREQPESVDVALVLGDLLREAGQVERAIQAHQALLTRNDLSRSERAQALAALGSDYRKAGFLDRATRSFEQVLAVDPKSIDALRGLQKLYEDQRLWREAYESLTRLSRQRKTDDSAVLGHLQAEMGREAARAGDREAAERAFRTALSLDRRVLPAYLGLADLQGATDPRRAALTLGDAVQAVPERAYLCFERLQRVYAATGEPSRFVALCESIIGSDPRDWRARLALARHLRAEERHEEACGLLMRAVAANPHALLVHLEMWRTLGSLGYPREHVEAYMAAADRAVLYRDPHVCTACRYRADDMLWRCPHCHRWGTLVEERLGPATRDGAES